MNRDVKFRIWDSKRKKFTTSVTDHHLNVFYAVIAVSGRVYFEREVDCGMDEYIGDVGEFSLCQYTGVKDKNGKEIYEGDIVNALYYGNEKYENMVVIFGKYEDLCWALASPIDDIKNEIYSEVRHDVNGTLVCEQQPLVSEQFAQYEIIGNIFENPDLLNE